MTLILQVLAQDGGSPPLNSTATIEVIVKDANDNAPEFEQAEYNISISENAPRGSQIIKVFIFLFIFRVL